MTIKARNSDANRAIRRCNAMNSIGCKTQTRKLKLVERLNEKH
jgi:hypothetical protein